MLRRKVVMKMMLEQLRILNIIHSGPELVGRLASKNIKMAQCNNHRQNLNQVLVFIHINVKVKKIS